MADKLQNFWSSIPGIFTEIAAVITAITGLYLAINGNGDNSTTQPAPTPVVNPVPSPTRPKPQPPKLPPKVAEIPKQTQEKVLFPETGHLVDCTLFPTVNTVTSLMSWSNYYHQQIIAADGIKRRASNPCNQAIDLRGMAHCKAPDDLKIRLALLETLTFCRAAGIEWQDTRTAP